MARKLEMHSRIWSACMRARVLARLADRLGRSFFFVATATWGMDGPATPSRPGLIQRSLVPLQRSSQPTHPCGLPWETAGRRDDTAYGTSRRDGGLVVSLERSSSCHLEIAITLPVS